MADIENKMYPVYVQSVRRNSMNVFILTDLEGIPYVDDIECMDTGSEKYRNACRYLTNTLNVAIQICFENGADRVYYLDGHGGGGNIRPEDIDPRGTRSSIAEWQMLLQNGELDCQIELGAHARAGTLGGFLDHTITSKAWFSHKVNGMEMSELSLHALLCAQYAVPVVACIGDEAACKQAKEYIPDIYTGAVKKADKRNRAHTYENCENIIVSTIQEALNSYEGVSLFHMHFPAQVELTFYRTDMCDEAYENAPESVERVNARTLRKTIPRLSYYEELKF